MGLNAARKQNLWRIGAAILVIMLPLLVTLTKYTHIEAQKREAMSCEQLAITLEARDNQSVISPRSVVLMGGSRISDWPSIPKTLANHPVLVRSLPNLRLSSVAECFDRAIAHYRPYAVLFWLEDRALDEPIDGLVSALEKIQERADYYGVVPTFAVVLPIPSPALAAKPQVQTRFYRELSARIESSSSVRIIDLSPVFGKDYRNPERHLFWPNGMRLNEEGYRKVAASLEAFLDSL